MPTRIKLSQFNHNISTDSDYVVGQSFAPDILVCLSDLHHQFALLPFDNQIRQDEGAKVIKNRSLRSPYIDGVMIRSFFVPCILSSSTKYIIEIFDQVAACIINFYTRMKLIATSILSLFYSADVETSFSINDTSKVSDLFGCMRSTKYSWFSHESPFVYYKSIINELTKYVQPERLNERAPVIGWCDSLTTIR